MIPNEVCVFVANDIILKATVTILMEKTLVDNRKNKFELYRNYMGIVVLIKPRSSLPMALLLIVLRRCGVPVAVSFWLSPYLHLEAWHFYLKSVEKLYLWSKPYKRCFVMTTLVFSLNIPLF